MWVQGTILNVCGSVLVNLAANLLKLSHNVDESDKISPSKQDSMPGITDALNHGVLRQYCFCPQGAFTFSSKHYWRLGAFLFAAGSIINFFSLSMAAQSLLATLGGVQFVSNIFFAGCILGEKVTKRGLIATGVIVLGLMLAVSFSDHKSTRYSASGLIALYDRTYITFIACVVTLIVIAEGTYLLYTAREKAGEPLMFSSIIRPVTYSIVSATVGTQSVLQSKCLAELLRTDIAVDKNTGNDPFANALFYIVLTAFLLGMAFWLYRLNNALKLFDGLVIIPIIQVFWVTSAVLQGGMFFKEFQEMSSNQSILFSIGVVTVFFGVYLIATSQNSVSRNGEDEDNRHHSFNNNGPGSSDRLTDPEKGENHEIEFTRKRSDSNVVIITCIGSPIHVNERNSKKLIMRNNSNSNSNNNSSKSNSYDGCDRYFEELSVIQSLNEDDEFEGNRELTIEEDDVCLPSRNIFSSEKSTSLSTQNRLFSKQFQSQVPQATATSTKNLLHSKGGISLSSSSSSTTSFPPSTTSNLYEMKSVTSSNISMKSSANNGSDLLPAKENIISTNGAIAPVFDTLTGTKTEGNSLKYTSLSAPVPAIISPSMRVRSESSCGLLENNENEII